MRSGWSMRRPDELVDNAARALSTRLAGGHTRRSFLGRMGGAVLAATGGAAVAAAVRPEETEAFHFCGHIWTTGSCPSPLGWPRIDRHGYPLRPTDGRRIDRQQEIGHEARLRKRSHPHVEPFQVHEHAYHDLVTCRRL